MKLNYYLAILVVFTALDMAQAKSDVVASCPKNMSVHATSSTTHRGHSGFPSDTQFELSLGVPSAAEFYTTKNTIHMTCDYTLNASLHWDISGAKYDLASCKFVNGIQNKCNTIDSPDCELTCAPKSS